MKTFTEWLNESDSNIERLEVGAEGSYQVFSADHDPDDNVVVDFNYPSFDEKVVDRVAKYFEQDRAELEKSCVAIFMGWYFLNDSNIGEKINNDLDKYVYEAVQIMPDTNLLKLDLEKGKSCLITNQSYEYTLYVDQDALVTLLRDKALPIEFGIAVQKNKMFTNGILDRFLHEKRGVITAKKYGL